MPRKVKQRQLSRRVSVKSLPVTASDRASRAVVGLLGMLVGINLIFWPWFLPALDPSASVGGWAVITLLLSGVGVWICISSTHCLTHSASLTITSEAVTFTVREWSDREQWSEPLANYEGVLLELETRWAGSHKHLIWNTWLEHPEEGRRILLWRGASENKARRFHERCCQLLKLAALEPTTEGVAPREAADLSEPLREVPAEQDGQAGPDTAASAPARLRVYATPREAEVTLLARMPWWEALTFVPAAAALWVFFAWHVQARWLLVLAILVSIVAAWSVLAWLWGAISRPRLRITDEAVELIRELPFGAWRVKRLGCDEIVGVTITKRADQLHEAVVLRGRRRQIRFGKWLKLDELKWLKNFILDRLAESSPAAASPSH